MSDERKATERLLIIMAWISIVGMAGLFLFLLIK